MADRSFEELIGDLLGQGMRVYVSTESGTYHYSRSCLESLVTKGKVRAVPAELAEWLGYAKCTFKNCKPDE